MCVFQLNAAEECGPARVLISMYMDVCVSAQLPTVCLQELLILFWKLIDENKEFLCYILRAGAAKRALKHPKVPDK